MIRGRASRGAGGAGAAASRQTGRGRAQRASLSTRIAAAALVLTSLAVSRLAAQDAERLAAQCAAGGSDLQGWCAEVTEGFEAVQAGLGLLASGGSDIPGTASTLGRRLGAIPRLAVSGRLGAVYVRVPDILDARATRAGATEDEALLVPGAQLAVALGVVDGFRLLPTVGGLLSLDLLAAVNFLVLPESEGFGQQQLTGYGVGARLGLIRESFTLPGLSLSLLWRTQGELAFGNVNTGDHGEAAFDLRTLSLRGTVGKSFLLLGVLGGVGYDRHSSDVRIAVVHPSTGTRGSATLDGFTSDRVILFGGASLSFLLLQVSAEGGWAKGMDRIPGRGPSEFDPGSASLFLNLALRVTL